MGGFKSWLINVICALVAYSASRLIWNHKEEVLPVLHWELLTFVAFYLVLQALLRGRKLAKKGKEG